MHEFCAGIDGQNESVGGGGEVGVVVDVGVAAAEGQQQ